MIIELLKWKTVGLQLKFDANRHREFSLCYFHNRCGHPPQLVLELLKQEPATHLHLEQRSKMPGALHPLSLYAFIVQCLGSVAHFSISRPLSLTPDIYPYISSTAISEHIARFQFEKLDVPSYNVCQLRLAFWFLLTLLLSCLYLLLYTNCTRCNYWYHHSLYSFNKDDLSHPELSLI